MLKLSEMFCIMWKYSRNSLNSDEVQIILCTRCYHDHLLDIFHQACIQQKSSHSLVSVLKENLSEFFKACPRPVIIATVGNNCNETDLKLGVGVTSSELSSYA